MKAPKHLDRIRHGIGREEACAEHGLSQSRDFPILVNLPQAAAGQACDLQTNRIGTNVNSGQDGHDRRRCSLASVEENREFASPECIVNTVMKRS
jgi:hypothetical protein